MLLSPLEVPNPAEDKAVRVVAPTLEVDDAVPPAKVLLGRPDGVSFVCWSSRGLLPSLLRVPIRTDGMAGYTCEWSGHVHSCLLLALHLRGAISTRIGLAIYLCHSMVNLAPPKQSSLQRSPPFSRGYSARLKGAHVFLEPRRYRPLGF